MKPPVCPEKYGGHQCETEGDHDTHACKCGIGWWIVDGQVTKRAYKVSLSKYPVRV